MKIDTSKITGYADMTAEEKLKALEEFEIETPKDNGDEVTKLKTALSKANSDAAECNSAKSRRSRREPKQSGLNAKRQLKTNCGRSAETRP